MLRFTLLANVRILHFNLLSIQDSCFDMPENNRLGICSSQMTSNKNSSIKISGWRIRLFKNKQRNNLWLLLWAKSWSVYFITHARLSLKSMRASMRKKGVEARGRCWFQIPLFEIHECFRILWFHTGVFVSQDLILQFCVSKKPQNLGQWQNQKP